MRDFSNVLDEVGLVLARSVDGGSLAGNSLLAATGRVANSGEKGGQDTKGELEQRGIISGYILLFVWCSFERMCLSFRQCATETVLELDVKRVGSYVV